MLLTYNGSPQWIENALLPDYWEANDSAVEAFVLADEEGEQNSTTNGLEWALRLFY